MIRIITMNNNGISKKTDSKAISVSLNNKKCIAESVKKLYDESERKVFEYGNFSDVKVKFSNKVKNLNVKDVELIIKPSILSDERPKERELEIVVRSSNEQQKYMYVLKRGEKNEIREFLQKEDSQQLIEEFIQKASEKFSETELY